MSSIISSPHFHKFQKHETGDRKDIISNLPDCILYYILSLLSTKDAVGTSVLAKRWKYLWTNLSVFDFWSNLYKIEKREDQIQKSTNCMLDLVYRLLNRSICIKKLRIAIYGIAIDADHVCSLIHAAVKHKVENLTLSLDLKDSFVLPHCLSASNSLNKLCLELDCVLNIPGGICFPSLKTLELSFITFSNEKSVQQLFSGCLVLQNLTMYSCDWKNGKISITIPTLRVLKIYYDNLSPDNLLNRTVKIDAVNLKSFTCTSYPTVEFVLVNLISIVEADIDVMAVDPSMQQYAAHNAIKLLGGLGSVKHLILSNSTLECLSFSKNFVHHLPLFQNLTRLDVDYGAYEDFTSETLMDILQKTPKLEVLDTPLGFNPDAVLDGEEWTSTSVPFCFKSSLKLFIISNFDGGANEIQLLKFLLNNATVLREIKILCSKSLSADLKKQMEISNQLQRIGLTSCAINFQ